MHRTVGQFAIFFVLMSLLVGGIHYYLWNRLVKAPDLGPTWQRAGGWALFGLGVMTPVGMAVGRLVDRGAARVLAAIVYGWMGLSILLFFTLVASELPRLIAIAAMHASSSGSAGDGDPLSPERRTFLARAIAGSVSLLALGLAGMGAASALGRIALARTRVTLRRLPASLSGFRVVQVSDLHIGPTLGNAWLAQVVRDVNAADPDIVVITGDLVDGSVASLGADVAPLADLRARHGVFFCTGNHEYYSGVDEWVAELTRLGVRSLRNERVSIGHGDASFDLAGVDDWGAKRFGLGQGPDLARALAGRDERRELVLLAHQPKQIVEAAQHGVGLQLSGHTHGGQIFPWGFFVRFDQPYVAGLSRHADTSTQIYVSRGTGFWGPPMRVGAPPEISVIELVAAA